MQKITFLLAPLREGRHAARLDEDQAVDISTHAPTRGATNVRLPSAVLSEISTHAPTRGATRRPGTCCTPREFLLAPLREGRLLLLNAPGTFSQFLLAPLREGRHHTVNFTIHKERLFLLAPLREGRQAERRREQALLRYFYSRPYARGDAARRESLRRG